MSLTIPGNLYGCWRNQRGTEGSLRERTDSAPAERLLQAAWHHQRVRRDQLKTIDGQTVRIFHPGFWNREAGPDFRGAVIQIGDSPAQTGDIEIDLHSAGWRGHGHEGNPNFQNVILHVVWESEAAPRQPTLVLKHFLDASIAELEQWLGTDSAQGFPHTSSGQCCAPLRDLAPDKLAELLRQAAEIRLQRKGSDLHARARAGTWEQSLRESIFRALGYKQNIWAMQRIAEITPLFDPAPVSPLIWQARLLGLSGLLPIESPARDSGKYLRTIWHAWWRERDAVAHLVLPRASWRFNALRPANHPQRRLALAAHWLSREDFLLQLQTWFDALPVDAPASTKKKINPAVSLLETLQVEGDKFWSTHWTFRAARLGQPQPLVGLSRVTDLAINAIIPWFWMRARVEGNEPARRRAERLYYDWPPAGDNSILRLARQRLLGGASAKSFQHAATQQGLLQVVRDFCDHSNAICSECRFPQLVSEFRSAQNFANQSLAASS